MEKCYICDKKFKSERSCRFLCKSCGKCFCTKEFCTTSFIKTGGMSGYCSYECCSDEFKKRFINCTKCQNKAYKVVLCEGCVNYFCEKCLPNKNSYCDQKECQEKFTYKKTCNRCLKRCDNILDICKGCLNHFCDNCSQQDEEYCNQEEYCNREECKKKYEESVTCKKCNFINNDGDYSLCDTCDQLFCKQCLLIDKIINIGNSMYNNYDSVKYCSKKCCPDDYIEERTCSMCDNCDLDSDEYDQCDTCNKYFCGKCSTNSVFDEDFYCSKECCPDDVWYKIYGEEERIQKIKLGLERVGVRLRSDSCLCNNYINNNKGNIDEIVERMCQMKFLFDYHDMNSFMTKAKVEQTKELDAGYFPDTTVLNDAEYEVMKRYGHIYPCLWNFPWQKIKSIDMLFEQRQDMIPEFLASQYNINRCIRKFQRIYTRRIYGPFHQFVNNNIKANYTAHINNFSKIV